MEIYCTKENMLTCVGRILLKLNQFVWHFCGRLPLWEKDMKMLVKQLDFSTVYSKGKIKVFFICKLKT